MRAANAAAAVVVGKRGTATVSIAELRSRILPAATLAPEEKIVFDWSRARRASRASGGAQGLRIGFTNGCFDLLHPGHVKLLAAARAAPATAWWSGLNSDASVRRLKGEGRPIQPSEARAEVLAALEAVDLVVVFDAGHAARADRAGAADGAGQGRRLSAASRWSAATSSRRMGGEVVLIDIVPGHSTSAMVERTRAPKAR